MHRVAAVLFNRAQEHEIGPFTSPSAANCDDTTAP